MRANPSLYAAEALRREIYRMVDNYNRLVEVGDKAVPKEEWLPYLHMRKSYPVFSMADTEEADEVTSHKFYC